MKKFFTLIVAMFMFGNIFAQDVQILIEDTFEEYAVDAKIAQAANEADRDWWTTWSNLPGSSEDGVVKELNGTKCGYLTYGTDQVILLGDEQSGVYDLEFDILVPQGKNGYFNILHDFKGSDSEWAMQCYLHMTDDGQNQAIAEGRGTIHAGKSNAAEIVCYYDQWMHFRLHINTDTDVAEYYYTAPGEEEALVCTWKWSLDSFGNTSSRKLAAMDFFPPVSAETSEYYIDNFKLTKTGGETAAELVVTPESIEETIDKNATKSVDITIENTGTSIADYTAYVDYGVGQDSDNYVPLTYTDEFAQEPGGVSWQSEEPLTFEIAYFFPASLYGSTVMGTKVTEVAYFLAQYVEEEGSETLIPSLEEGTNLTFRVYEAGVDGYPRNVLAEKVVAQDEIQWNAYTVAVFDEPVALRGFDIYVAIEMTQAVDGIAMITDQSTAVEGFGDLYRQSKKSPFVSLTEVSGTNYGNWLVAMGCSGDPVTGGFATLAKTAGSLAIGASDKVTVNLSSFGLAEGEYEATVKFNTNVPGKEVIEIPLTLNVGGVDVSEMSENVYTIYPNPTSDKVMVEGENISHIAIYNATGQLVNVVVNNNVVDMSSYENGVYFFNVIDNAGQSSVQRIVVAK